MQYTTLGGGKAYHLPAKASAQYLAEKLYFDENGQRKPLLKSMTILALINMEHKRKLEKMLKDHRAGRDITPLMYDDLRAVNEGIFEAFALAYPESNPADHKTKWKNIRSVHDDFMAMMATRTGYDVKTNRKELKDKIRVAAHKYSDVPKIDWAAAIDRPLTPPPSPPPSSPGSGPQPGQGSGGQRPGTDGEEDNKDNTPMKILVAAGAAVAAFFALKG